MHKHPLTLRCPPSLGLARVLLVHRDLTSRLALQTILQAGGYSVDVASTPSEALTQLDEGVYQLVLCESDSSEDGRHLLAYARVKEYRPATAMITGSNRARTRISHSHVAIHTEDLAGLLGKVAELIGLRASRRYGRTCRAEV